jgi:hypothetical protein
MALVPPVCGLVAGAAFSLLWTALSFPYSGAAAFLASPHIDEPATREHSRRHVSPFQRLVQPKRSSSNRSKQQHCSSSDGGGGGGAAAAVLAAAAAATAQATWPRQRVLGPTCHAQGKEGEGRTFRIRRGNSSKLDASTPPEATYGRASPGLVRLLARSRPMWSSKHQQWLLLARVSPPPNPRPVCPNTCAASPSFQPRTYIHTQGEQVSRETSAYPAPARCS